MFLKLSWDFVQIFDMMDPKARSDCLKEAQLLQSLNHPNIVKYYDSFIESNQLNIILELAEFGDLGDMINKAKKSNTLFMEKVIWGFFSQISAAVSHMHENRVMHRDIKPNNIFIASGSGNDVSLKLGDLGLSRYFSSKTMEVFSLVGTPVYMSPERILEDGYDFKSDVWSLGCILYELAALKPPFYSENYNLYLLGKKIRNSDFEPISDIYSTELRTLVTVMLQPSPESRPDITQVNQISLQMFSRF
eukprot:TRINITY_DN7648_c0_g1_i1.p1 TRINITY_DN7648_c0_g1~~TRINITY_DN7648_c0_g1_i1.p1  ORF type:complete len:248 (+),score=46.34 TRINITY_DN7648_c0_g1_i1:169-912(+)